MNCAETRYVAAADKRIRKLSRGKRVYMLTHRRMRAHFTTVKRHRFGRRLVGGCWTTASARWVFMCRLSNWQRAMLGTLASQRCRCAVHLHMYSVDHARTRCVRAALQCLCTTRQPVLAARVLWTFIYSASDLPFQFICYAFSLYCVLHIYFCVCI